MLKQNDPVLLDSVKPTSQELWALSIDFAAGYKHLSVMCFYEKLPAKYAGGVVKVEEQQNQTAEKLVSRLLQQLLQQIGVIPKNVEAVYEDHVKTETRLGREESLAILRSVAASFAQVFIVIDALDECEPAILNGFIRPLTKSPDIRIMVTSRDLPHIEHYFSSSRRLEIRANEADIRSYVKDRINEEVELAGFVNEDDSLHEEILGTLVQRSCGM
ncbi:MAG: hypothetical protein Q9167_001453 [Letrouitia subvulpina]